MTATEDFSFYESLDAKALKEHRAELRRDVQEIRSLEDPHVATKLRALRVVEDRLLKLEDYGSTSKPPMFGQPESGRALAFMHELDRGPLQYGRSVPEVSKRWAEPLHGDVAQVRLNLERSLSGDRFIPAYDPAELVSYAAPESFFAKEFPATPEEAVKAAPIDEDPDSDDYWRDLREGEQILRGDRLLARGQLGPWGLARTSVGYLVGGDAHRMFRYRRQTHRALRPGERLMPGDEYRIRFGFAAKDKWMQSINAVTGRAMENDCIYRRRIAK